MAREHTARATDHFKADCLPIVRAVQKSPEIWARAAVFVILTIRQMFTLMERQMAEVDDVGADAKALFGWKRSAYRYIQAHKYELWQRAKLAKSGQITLNDLIQDYLAIPGLGIVKASFLAQLTVGDGACIDAHNLRVLGLNTEAFKTPKTLLAGTIRKRIEAYNAVWRVTGDSATWWNLWCDGLAVTRPTWFANGAEVSALHRKCILGKEQSR